MAVSLEKMSGLATKVAMAERRSEKLRSIERSSGGELNEVIIY